VDAQKPTPEVSILQGQVDSVDGLLPAVIASKCLSIGAVACHKDGEITCYLVIY
jgi:hypothetical protein